MTAAPEPSSGHRQEVHVSSRAKASGRSRASARRTRPGSSASRSKAAKPAAAAPRRSSAAKAAAVRRQAAGKAVSRRAAAGLLPPAMLPAAEQDGSCRLCTVHCPWLSRPGMRSRPC
ncbi:hypothetical protein NSU01_29245 [Paenibacillus sp. FSL H8-0259]|uniref:hypothetical protein n=1 Tax=Paenibacillus sp. FSL H8-0259 TaxID=1920423 RepID=UPI0030D755DB